VTGSPTFTDEPPPQLVNFAVGPAETGPISTGETAEFY
jgi:hypothetical protein